jgi:hypothetical protein
MDKKMASETSFFDRAHKALDDALKFMRQKFRAADSYHGKDAKAFWIESKNLADESIAFLEQNIFCLQVANQDQLESLEDAIERTRMGYAEYKDQLSLVYWSLSAAIDLKERLEGRNLIKVRSCEDMVDSNVSVFNAVENDIAWVYAQGAIPGSSSPSTWQHQPPRTQTPALAGVFYVS